MSRSRVSPRLEETAATAGASLGEAILRGASLGEADLRGASLGEAELRGGDQRKLSISW